MSRVNWPMFGISMLLAFTIQSAFGIYDLFGSFLVGAFCGAAGQILAQLIDPRGEDQNE